jgi:uncharacterized membrane protein YfcA
VAEQLLIFVISLIANLFSALSGGGAGLIQLPALIFLGLPFGIALATHKVATIALGIGATARHLKDNKIQSDYALLMVLTGVPGVILGASFILQVPDELAKTALGLLTMGLGIYSFFSPDLGQMFLQKNRHFKGYLIGGLVLFLIGILNGSLTSGTGLFVTLFRHRALRDTLVDQMVWFRLQTGRRLHSRLCRSFLECFGSHHVRFTGRNSLGVDSSIVTRFIHWWIYRCTSIHRER